MGFAVVNKARPVPLFVIASEAKQSMHQQQESWIASLRSQ
jgi:hypothetical protein